MQVKKTEFKDLLIIDKTVFKDKRGLFKEIIDEKPLEDVEN